MSTNQGSHLLAAASRGMREWIHTPIPVHSLPQMGASKPMNRSWVAQPNRSQWHPQTATTPCLPPWPPTQKRRATRRKDAAEKKNPPLGPEASRWPLQANTSIQPGIFHIKNSTFSKSVGVESPSPCASRFTLASRSCCVTSAMVMFHAAAKSTANSTCVGFMSKT